MSTTYQNTALANWDAMYALVGLADALDTIACNALRGEKADAVAQLARAMQIVARSGLIHAEALLSPEEMGDDAPSEPEGNDAPTTPEEQAASLRTSIDRLQMMLAEAEQAGDQGRQETE